jgi:hypothetical protein
MDPAEEQVIERELVHGRAAMGRKPYLVPETDCIV